MSRAKMWIPHGNYCQVAQGAAVEDLSEDVTIMRGHGVRQHAIGGSNLALSGEEKKCSANRWPLIWVLSPKAKNQVASFFRRL